LSIKLLQPGATNGTFIECIAGNLALREGNAHTGVLLVFQRRFAFVWGMGYGRLVGRAGKGGNYFGRKANGILGGRMKGALSRLVVNVRCATSFLNTPNTMAGLSTSIW
jgi:hypothetical protein